MIHGIAQDVTWSRDGRALMLWFYRPIMVGGGLIDWDGIGLFTWQEGRVAKMFYSHQFYQEDYLWDFHWSPNGRLIAFRVGGSGNRDMNDGKLLVYDPIRKRLLPMPTLYTRRLQWVNAQTLRYWPTGFWSYNKGKENFAGIYTKKPRLWRIAPE